MSMILTQSSSPGVTTCSGASTCCSAISEMWTSPSIPSPTCTNAPNGTSFVTRPYTSSPTWCPPANSCQGSCWVALSESEIRSRDRSTSRTCTVTSSPTCTTDDGWSTCFQDSSETWTSPSMPPRSTNAPKLTTDDTTPL